MLTAFCLAASLLMQFTGMRSAQAAGKPETTTKSVDADISEERDLSPLPDAWFDDALFLGDSITATLQAWCTVHEAFGDAMFLPAKSFSVQRDILPVRQFVLRTNYWTAAEAVEAIGAGKVFLMVGMNDLSPENGVENTMKAWDEFVPGIRGKSPDVQIYVQSLIPTHFTAEPKGLGNEKIGRYNSELRRFCEENDCVYVDIAPYLKDSDNNLRNEYSFDRYVHLNEDGAAIWAEQLKNPANYSVDPREADHEEESYG